LGLRKQKAALGDLLKIMQFNHPALVTPCMGYYSSIWKYYL